MGEYVREQNGPGGQDRITLVLCADQDMTIDIFAQYYHSSDDMGDSTRQQVMPEADRPQTVELTLEDWARNHSYWLEITAENVWIDIELLLD